MLGVLVKEGVMDYFENEIHLKYQLWLLEMALWNAQVTNAHPLVIQQIDELLDAAERFQRDAEFKALSAKPPQRDMRNYYYGLPEFRLG